MQMCNNKNEYVEICAICILYIMKLFLSLDMVLTLDIVLSLDNVWSLDNVLSQDNIWSQDNVLSLDSFCPCIMFYHKKTMHQ